MFLKRQKKNSPPSGQKYLKKNAGPHTQKKSSGGREDVILKKKRCGGILNIERRGKRSVFHLIYVNFFFFKQNAPAQYLKKKNN